MEVFGEKENTQGKNLLHPGRSSSCSLSIKKLFATMNQSSLFLVSSCGQRTGGYPYLASYPSPQPAPPWWDATEGQKATQRVLRTSLGRLAKGKLYHTSLQHDKSKNRE